MQRNSVSSRLGTIFGVIVLAGLLAGCTSGFFSRSSSSVPTAGDGLSPMATVVEGYSDIELPLEMKLNPEKSMNIRTESFQGGIISYSGRVQLGSLKDYIIVSMRNNKWKLAGEASYKNILLAFMKANKTCMVVLSEGIGGTLGKTQADFYVTVDLAAENRASQFGAPLNQ